MTALPVAGVDDDEFPAFPDLTMPLRAPDGPLATGFDETSLAFPEAADAEADADEDVDAEDFEALPIPAVAGM